MYYSKQYMNQVKRQLSDDMSWEDDTKKFRTSVITYMEDLCNELIYEIFDYLDGREIFNAFSNLNIRFKHLVMSPLLPLKICHSSLSDQLFEHDCRRIIIPNKHRIISLRLMDRKQFVNLFTINPIDSSFHRLECLILHEIKSDELISFLPNLTNLPRLFSLNICLVGASADLNEIYGLIFRLSTLKYIKLTIDNRICPDSISAPVNEQFSSIEKLVINHQCSLRELYNILSFTPKLRHLTCTGIYQLNPIPTAIPLKIFYLTHCSIKTYIIYFDEFEIFIKQISSQLRYLRFNVPSDISYLDADRWERLISRHIPYLHTFRFKYRYTFSHHSQFQFHRSFISFINRFTSSFWIEKRWIFDIQTDLNNCEYIKSVFSIQPNRKQLNNTSDLFQHECMDISKSMSRLTILGNPIVYSGEWFSNYSRFICSLTAITCLYIEFNAFFIFNLVQFLHSLPNIDSITIAFKLPNQTINIANEEINTIRAALMMNKITKMNIEQVTELNHVDILIHLFPQIEYLQVKCGNYLKLEPIVRLVLMKRGSKLNSLCFGVPDADDSMVKKLQTMIYFEKLLTNYKIQRVYNRIYIFLIQ